MLKRDPLAKPEVLIRRVYSYVAYRIGDGPEAEDVTSEVFERALRYRHSFDSSKGTPVAWLIGIARRCIEQPADPVRPAPDAGADVEAPGVLEDDAATRLTVRAAMARMDDRDRELLALRYGADLTARQIAELLDERTNTVEVALHRALARLRGLLDDGDDEAIGQVGVVRPDPT
jgi:RNA polymerase sigma-70 factor (ECF subfamily)